MQTRDSFKAEAVGSCSVFACGAEISASILVPLMNASCVQAWGFRDAAIEHSLFWWAV